MNFEPIWGFYGREANLSALEERLGLQDERRTFSAMRIVGRRGVGKSALIDEAERRSPSAVPIVICELPNPDGDGVDALAERMQKAAAAAGLKGLHARLLPALTSRRPQSRFCELVERFVENRAVVALDEFHHARELGLESDFKLMIDRFGKIGAPDPGGKLVLMGSHQQKMLRMFRSDQPLHGRARGIVRVRQWRVPTVLTMAAEHGLLAHPRRFLTLWTAYGGMPGHWKRFVTEREWRRLRDFAAWDSEDEWRAAFVERERQHLADEEEARFDDDAFVQLTPMGRDILLHLAAGSGGGFTTKEFPKAWRTTERRTAKGQAEADRRERAFEHELFVLSKHLEMIEQSHAFLRKEGRWRIVDNNTLFQLDLEDPVPRRGRRAAARKIMDRVKTHEGPAFERMVAGWIGASPDSDLLEQGAWLPTPPRKPGEPEKDIPDIDVLAVMDNGFARSLVLAGCKRSARQQRPRKLKEQFRKFLEAAGEGGDEQALEMLEMPQRRLVASPAFEEEPVEGENWRERRSREERAGHLREACRRHGFERLDIARMAREPFEAGLPKPRPKPKRKPDPDRGPSSGM